MVAFTSNMNCTFYFHNISGVIKVSVLPARASMISVLTGRGGRVGGGWG